MKTLLPLLAMFFVADVTPTGCSAGKRSKPPVEPKTSAVRLSAVLPS
jgi:hypothetical protein